MPNELNKNTGILIKDGNPFNFIFAFWKTMVILNVIINILHIIDFLIWKIKGDKS